MHFSRVKFLTSLFFCMTGFVLIQGHALADLSHVEGEIRASQWVANLSGLKMSLVFRGASSYGNTTGRGKNCLDYFNSQEELLIAIDSSTGNPFEYRWIKARKSSQEINITADDAEAKAWDLLKLHFPELLTGKLILKEKLFQDEGSRGKIFLLRWGKESNDVIQPFGVRIEIAAQTGQIVGVSIGDYKIIIPTDPKISKSQAIGFALAASGLQDRAIVKDAKLAVSDILGNQRLEWRIILQGILPSPFVPARGQTAQEVIREAKIDATTGRVINALTSKVLSKDSMTLRSPVPSPKAYLVIDSYPSWMGPKNISFRTQRILSKDNQIFTKTNVNSSTDTLCIFMNRVMGVFVSPKFIATHSSDPRGEKIAFGMANSVFVLDITKGVIGRCNDASVIYRGQPSWHPDGQHLAMSGTHSPSDGGGADVDIFMAKVEPYLGPVAVSEQWCVAKLPGADNFPVISPDGKWVAFAHLEKDSPGRDTFTPVWAIYMAKTAKPKRGEQSEPPPKIIEDIMLPERLSWFPDGKRLLIAYTGNEGTKDEGILELKRWPDILNVETKTLTPLNLPPLYDPDLPQGKGIPLVVREPQVSLDGKQIVFRALRWSGDPKDDGAICVYTCNLDGSDLKRITPPKDVPFEPYQYPQPGINALNAWERLEPKPNRGTPWSEEIMMQERKKELEEREKKKREAAGMPAANR